MSQFKPYQAYKDSGVEWLGDIPEAWEVWKISHAFGALGSGTTPPTTEAKWYEEGTVPWVTTGELRENVIFETKKLLSPKAITAFPALQMHPAGSLAIAMYGATIGRLGILGVDATTNQACCLLTKPVHLDIKFTFYWLHVFKQDIIDLYATGGGQPNINQEVIASLKVPAPILREQTQIALFLDYETARIDALIEEQKRLIELLKEKRQAVISHAVTKGLDPTVPMKDSGVEWLGEVPVHWEILTTKRLFRLVVDPAPNDNNFELLSVYTEIGVRPRKELAQKGNKASTTDGYWKVKKGDLIVNKLLAWMGAVGYSNYNGVTSPAYDILRPTRQLSSKFYHYIFRGKSAQQEFKRWSRGIMEMRLRLYFDELGRIPMPFPPSCEQGKIVKFIEEMETKFDALSSEASEQVRLLSERRSALISAAVTGKIDVRSWQPPISIESENSEHRAM